MTLAITTVSTAISKVTVKGVTIKDLGKIPPSGLRVTPILFPNPENPLSNFTPTIESFGGGSSRLTDVEYDLNYMYLHCEMGAGRTGLDYLEECMLKIQAIYDAVLNIDTFSGGVDIIPTGDIALMTISDPSGKNYLGCTLTFHVREFWR